jgi:lambda family phage minor tail protein L
MNSKKINTEIHNLESSSIVELFELDVTPYNVGVFRFHAGTNGIHTDIIWQGEDYISLPIEVEEIEAKADGTMPRPRLRVANAKGALSKVISSYEDLVGLKLRRKRTYLKYLDAANFVGSENPYGIPDIDSHFPDDVFIVNQKLSETPEALEFELASPLEMENVMLPARQVQADSCSFSYRGPSCGYGGPPIADEKDRAFFLDIGNGYGLTSNFTDNQDISWDKNAAYVSGDVVTMESFDKARKIYFVCTPSGANVSGSDPRLDKANWKSDMCSKRVYGCYLRHSDQADEAGLPFGGCPGTHRYKVV